MFHVTVLFTSDFNPAHRLGNCENQNQHQADRGNPFEHNTVKFLYLERTVYFYFILHSLRTNKMSDADTGENRYNGHQNTVAEEIKEIQKSQSDNLDETQRSEAQGNDGSQNQDVKGYYKGGFFSASQTYLLNDELVSAREIEEASATELICNGRRKPRAITPKDMRQISSMDKHQRYSYRKILRCLRRKRQRRKE